MAVERSSGPFPFRRLTEGFSLHGVGLHSGRDCVLAVEPCDGGPLLRHEGAEMPLSRLGLAGTGRGSDYVFPDGHRVRTCEHVLSALVGLGAWGVRMTVEGPEMPALDGCAQRVAECVMEHSEPCGAGPEPFALAAPLRVGDESRFVAAFPSSRFCVTCVVRYESPLIGTQMLDLALEPGAYLEQVARARTFAMEAELEALRARGMALGGSLDNAVLVGSGGIRAAGGLRWPDEFVRHKALDLIGDLAAVGRPLCAHVVAVRAGHELHLRLAERLRALSGGHRGS